MLHFLRVKDFSHHSGVNDASYSGTDIFDQSLDIAAHRSQDRYIVNLVITTIPADQYR